MSEQEFLPLEVSIPNEAGWPKKTLDELCSLISRGTAPVYVEGSSVLAIGQRCVTTSRFAPEFARPHADRAMRNVLRPESGDVLLNSTGTGTIGRSVVFDHDGAFIVDGHVTVFRPRAETADGRWLNAVLRTSWGQRHLERFCYAGSTNQLELSRKPVKASALPVPTVQEQQGIAQILDIFDTAIRETEALIDKLKAVKQGLLHDLLTRGIDANSQLRPPQSEAPQLYKESPLGWIPREWDIEPIINLTSNSAIGPFGSDLVASDYRDSGVPVIFVRDVKPDQLVWKSNVFVSASKAQTLAAHEVRAGDVVATKMGLPPCVAAVYPESMPCGIVTADIVRLRPCTDRIRPDWMSIFINFSAVAKQVEQITAGVTRPKVTLRDVRDLLIGLPPIKEQERVLDRLTAMQSRIQIEEALYEKLTAEKVGLMNDLLTGRVRVTPLLESMQQAAAQTEA